MLLLLSLLLSTPLLLSAPLLLTSSLLPLLVLLSQLVLPLLLAPPSLLLVTTLLEVPRLLLLLLVSPVLWSVPLPSLDVLLPLLLESSLPLPLLLLLVADSGLLLRCCSLPLTAVPPGTRLASSGHKPCTRCFFAVAPASTTPAGPALHAPGLILVTAKAPQP
jgi:hypothetical protein